MKIRVKTETKNTVKSADATPTAENPISKMLQNSGGKFFIQLKQKAAAVHWATDEGFMRFLTVLDMNNLPIYRVSSKCAPYRCLLRLLQRQPVLGRV